MTNHIRILASTPRAVFAVAFDLFDCYVLRHRYHRVCNISYELYPDNHPVTGWATRRLGYDE